MAIEDRQSEAPAQEAASEESGAVARQGSSNGDGAAAQTAPALLPPNDYPVAAPLGPVTVALRYKVQFTADQAYVDFLERARDLLWHQLPKADLAALQRLALEALVDKLMTRKCGAVRPETAQRPRVSIDAAPAPVQQGDIEGGSSRPSERRDIGDAAPARPERCEA
jgi:hypothetical protein